VCLGAHPDDIEIGCFGALAALRARGRALEVRWAVCSGSPERREEARESAERLLEGTDARLHFGEFEDSFFPGEWGALKRWLLQIREGFDADLAFTHHREDRHQDHRLVSELTWNLFRDALVVEYEVPKYDGELGAPNAFVAMSPEVCRRKAEHLLEHFPSQADRGWFTAETFTGLARVRGIESGAPEGYAEAFHARKLLLDLGG
jgi:LmbE family N-acetylglucosaminyl deacetylase